MNEFFCQQSEKKASAAPSPAIHTRTYLIMYAPRDCFHRQQPPPQEWLRFASDVWREMDPTEEEEKLCWQSILLPVCALDCTDGDLYHLVLGAWCVPWRDVPKTPFLAAWLSLGAVHRRALLQERMIFAEELDVDRWVEHMLRRDDAAMLAALPVRRRVECCCVSVLPRMCLACGAAQCLAGLVGAERRLDRRPLAAADQRHRLRRRRAARPPRPASAPARARMSLGLLHLRRRLRKRAAALPPVRARERMSLGQTQMRAGGVQKRPLGLPPVPARARRSTRRRLSTLRLRCLCRSMWATTLPGVPARAGRLSPDPPRLGVCREVRPPRLSAVHVRARRRQFRVERTLVRLGRHGRSNGLPFVPARKRLPLGRAPLRHGSVSRPRRLPPVRAHVRVRSVRRSVHRRGETGPTRLLHGRARPRLSL